MAELPTKADAKKSDEPIAMELPTAAQPDDPCDGPATGQHQADVPIDGEIKKKKKRKSKAKKPGLRKGATGFEEYFAEGPIAPEEAQLEGTLYDTKRPFVDRIEDCIQRYLAKRRLSNERKTMLNKYFFLGGIDPSPKQFAGGAGDADALAEADKDTARLMVANTFVGDYNCGDRFYSITDAHNWVVDFSGIVRGFLSRAVPEYYAYDEDAFKTAADTIKNFLNYILIHNACPDYRDDILIARSICEIAPIELKCAKEIQDALPDHFHLAAADIFSSPRQDDEQKQQRFEAFCLYQRLCTHGNQDLAQEMSRMNLESLRITDTVERTYEVVEIHHLTSEKRSLAEKQLGVSNNNDDAKVLGSLIVRPAIIAHGYSSLPRPDEVDFSQMKSLAEEILLADDIVSKFERGMKMCLVMCELNNGLKFIKEVLDVRVSFDEFIPQSLLADYKQPTLNERPAPSIHDIKETHDCLDDGIGEI